MLTFLFRGGRRRAARQSHAAARRPFVPRLEALEDRSLPSTVTNLADSGPGSLRGQLAAAAPGDTIDFAPDLSGAIALGSTLTLDRNITVVGNLDPAGNPLVTLTRSSGDRDLAVNPGVTASVSGLTFTGATANAIFNRGSLTLRHVAVTGNHIELWGNSYVTIYNEGTLVVQDSRITDNHVHQVGTVFLDDRGGGIWNAGTLTVANSTIANNTAQSRGVSPGSGWGGGIHNTGGTVTITGSTITGNSASVGGGIYSTRTIAITDSTISGNLA